MAIEAIIFDMDGLVVDLSQPGTKPGCAWRAVMPMILWEQLI
jgi:beta-phosphoglucomutase-like phosphatase (HAD superfamily)